jgi:hypothetical protein
MLDGERSNLSWSEFMEGFWQRHPGLKGQGGESVGLVARTPSQVAKQGSVEPLGKQMMQERVEWDKKQASSDHDDGDIWDAKED